MIATWRGESSGSGLERDEERTRPDLRVVAFAGVQIKSSVAVRTVDRRNRHDSFQAGGKRAGGETLRREEKFRAAKLPAQRPVRNREEIAAGKFPRGAGCHRVGISRERVAGLVVGVDLET